MNRFVRLSAVLALAACLSPALGGERVSIAAPVKLRFDPRFTFEAVAQRMNVTLRREVPLPAVFLESSTPLAQFQDAMERQWQFRPPLVANAYSIERNEIYLSDDASFYLRLKRSIDDSLAHEFVHYIQAMYFNEDLSTDGCEVQAVEIQRWFREAHMRESRETVAQAEATGPASADDAPKCVLVPGDAGTRAVRCATGSRPISG
ncbi:MAG TPA: hypothetical protein VLD36_04770 [Burkholderiales bacterium]|nr:hypothetical protein [Burkholderiales bacterium]